MAKNPLPQLTSTVLLNTDNENIILPHNPPNCFREYINFPLTPRQGQIFLYQSIVDWHFRKLTSHSICSQLIILDYNHVSLYDFPTIHIVDHNANNSTIITKEMKNK